MPDPRAKPLGMIEGHRSKAEEKKRAEGEAKLRTGIRLQKSPEVKNDPVASAHFNRLKRIFHDVEMDEAFYENGINRYCLMMAEHQRMMAEREKSAGALAELEKARDDGMSADVYFAMRVKLEDALAEKDKTIAKLRDQLLLIERENLMTVQGKLRAVPKRVEKQLTGIAAYKAKMGG